MIAMTTQSRLHHRGRDWRIDFCRGIALWIIFSDHIQGNVLSQFTPLNLGFSDMAEVFVLISGYVGGIAYRERIRAKGFIATCRRALIRAGQIYLAYAVTTVFLFPPHPPVISLWLTTPQQFGVPLGIMLDQFTQRFVDALCLRTPSNLAILTSYVCFVTLLPAIVLLANRFPRITLFGSISLYVSVQWFPNALSLPTPIASACYFNPLAWQLIFVAGVLAGTLSDTEQLLPKHSIWLAAASLTLLIGLLLRLLVREEAIPWIGKPNLESGRLIHFGAVVVVAAQLLFARPVKPHNCFHPLILCGQHSLLVFCSGVILSTLATAILAQGLDSVALQLHMNVVGWCAMTCIAYLVSRIAVIWAYLRTPQRHLQT